MGPAGHRVLLSRLLALIDGLVQAVDSYYESTRRVFGRRRHGKKETAEHVVDWQHANHHDMVSRVLP